MGIDLGTSSVKVMISDLTGRIVGEGQEKYGLISLRPGWAEQSPQVWWDCTVRAARAAVAEIKEGPSSIAGIGFSGQMHGLVPLDDTGEPVRNSLIWADQRSGAQIQSLYEKTNRGEMARVTFNAVAPGFLAASLLWMKEQEPENFRKIETAVFPKDYIRYRLTGKIGTDISDASGSGIFDAVRCQWPEFLESMGLPAKLFPKVYGSQEIVGEVTAEAAEETGLLCGTPVVCGGGDTPMYCVGNGLIRPGMLSVNIGTAGQIVGCVDRPCCDEKLRTNTFCLPVPGRWILTGASLNGGIALDWVRKGILQIPDYEEMNEMAASVPAGSDGLIFLPYLLGERTPHMDPYARGVYFGLSINHSRSTMMRAAMEGVAFALKEALEVLEGVADFEDTMTASGGGARSPVFLQMQADIFGKKIACTDGKEEAGMGACITAAVGLGLYPDFRTACGEMVRMLPEMYVPDQERHEIYQEKFEIFKKIYQRNKELFLIQQKGRGNRDE